MVIVKRFNYCPRVSIAEIIMPQNYSKASPPIRTIVNSRRPIGAFGVGHIDQSKDLLDAERDESHCDDERVEKVENTSTERATM